MAFQEITVTYTLINKGKNTVTCKSRQESIIIEPYKIGSIYVCISGSTFLTVTESNNPNTPLTVTLTQTSDTSIDIRPSGNNWQIKENDNEWLCEMIGANGEIEAQQSHPKTVSKGSETIVIVGTVEIWECAH
ncbi:MAG: hypothetical protein ACRCYO_04665 [Bacteroidia bacterium]